VGEPEPEVVPLTELYDVDPGSGSNRWLIRVARDGACGENCEGWADDDNGGGGGGGAWYWCCWYWCCWCRDDAGLPATNDGGGGGPMLLLLPLLLPPANRYEPWPEVDGVCVYWADGESSCVLGCVHRGRSKSSLVISAVRIYRSAYYCCWWPFLF
jgi:hypothetical protein